MPVTIYRRPGSLIYSYRGSAAGRRLRGSTRTTDKTRALQIAADKENEQWKRSIDGPKAVLTFAKASMLYRAAGKVVGKGVLYHRRIEDYWKDTLVKDMTAGAIRQSAIDIHPSDSGATRNRQVLTATQAVINHCAEMELCAPIRIRRFPFDRKIKKPIMPDWLNVFCAHARPMTAALATFMFATGCRISEARRVEWSDIDFPQRTILIRKTKTKRQRLPHMPQRLLVVLANLPRDCKPFGRSESSLRRDWDEDVAKAAEAVTGFERLTFHSCRHGIVTKLLRDRVDVITIGRLVGLSPQLILSTYGHAINDARLTDSVFDPDLTQPSVATNKINGLE